MEFKNSDVSIFDNFFTDRELTNLSYVLQTRNWTLSGESNKKTGTPEGSLLFWHKDLNNSFCNVLFFEKLKEKFNIEIEFFSLYANGQSNNQCGYWHTDSTVDGIFTLVFFYNNWKPEYGGHLMIKDFKNIVHSILPFRNRAVIFKSNLKHMALDPSRHCLFQRESIACKFKIL